MYSIEFIIHGVYQMSIHEFFYATNEFNLYPKMYSIMGILEFSSWLQAEMDKRGLNQSDLAREAGLSRGAVGNVLRQEREPGPDFLNGIAHAFKMRPADVFTIAGVLSQAPESDPLTRQAEWLMSQLDPGSKQEAIDFIQFLADKQQRRQGAKQNNDATAQLGKPIPSAP